MRFHSPRPNHIPVPVNLNLQQWRNVNHTSSIHPKPPTLFFGHWSFSLFYFILYPSCHPSTPSSCAAVARLGEYKWPNGRSFSPSTTDIWRGNLWVCRLHQFKLWPFLNPLLKLRKWTKTDLLWFTRRFERLCLSRDTDTVIFSWGELLLFAGICKYMQSKRW